MKKPGLAFFVLSCSLVFFLLLGSCLTLPLLVGQPSANQSNNSGSQPEPKNEPAPPQNKPEDLGWRIGQFTNTWGDKTDNYFMVFNKSITARSSGFAGNKSLTVSNITFSEIQGLTFRLYEIDTILNRREEVELNGKISVVLRYGNNEEKTIEGKTFVNSRGLVLGLNDELVKILSREENINFRITTNYVDLISYYQFDFKPDNFTKAYEQLKSYSKN